MSLWQVPGQTVGWKKPPKLSFASTEKNVADRVSWDREMFSLRLRHNGPQQMSCMYSSLAEEFVFSSFGAECGPLGRNHTCLNVLFLQQTLAEIKLSKPDDRALRNHGQKLQKVFPKN